MHIKKQQEVDLPHVVREELWSDSATFVNITGSFCVSDKCHGVGLGEVYQVQCGSVIVWQCVVWQCFSVAPQRILL